MSLSAVLAQEATAADRPYTLAAFDFDGTLADTLPWFDSVLDEVADKYRFRKATAQEKSVLRHRDAREVLAFLGIPMWKAPAILVHVRGLMAERAAEVSLFDGIAAELRALKTAGLRLAMVSSNTMATVRRVLGPDLAALFDDYECGVDLFGKSAKLKRLNRHHGPGGVILVGDELRDIQAAHAAGVHAAAVAWGYNHIDALRGGVPEKIMLTVSDITRTLLT
jgi:phosphoglycolate phosphatase